MGLTPDQEKIIQLLVAQERLLSKLYAVFAEQFPNYADFWAKLSKEEEAHAMLIEKLREAEQKGLVFFDVSKINIYALNTFIDRLGKLVEKAEQSEFTQLSAFTCAVDYETALIEKNVFTHFSPANVKVKNTLKTLQSETVKHTEKIKHMRMEATVK
ncbi:MAG: hypothetical protein KKH68_05290 [Proteobacteria bacterium]|nr:hypothetical protein [Pseudomonadota bacterium]